MASLLGAVASPVLGAFGVNAAGDQQRKYLNASMGELDKGYGKAIGTQQGIFDPAMAGWKGVGDKFQAGGFDPGQAQAFQSGPFKFNFQEDPGYKYALQQGLNQIKGPAAQAGMAHSPQTEAALMGRATDMAAQHYGDVYARQRGAFEADRGFGAQEQGNAYDRNSNNLARQFQMGQSLFQNPMMQSGQNLSELQTALAQGRAGIQQQKGNIAGQIAAAPWAAGAGVAGAIPDGMGTSLFNKGMDMYSKGLY